MAFNGGATAVGNTLFIGDTRIMNAPNAVSNHLENGMKSGHGISQSQSIQEISKALFSVQSQMMAVAKDADNTFYRAKYATLHAVWQTLQPLMKDAGLVVMQSSGDSKTVVIRVEHKGNWVEQTIVFMDFITRVTHSESGEWIQSVSEVPLGKIDPQGYGSAMTYARRYCLSALMGIVVDDDDDGNAGSGRQPSQNQNRNGSQPAQQRQQQQQSPNQQQRQQQPTGQQGAQNQAPQNQPPAGQAAQPPTALQRLGAFLKQAGCNGKEDASLLIDFIAPSHNWETVQNEEIALFVINLVNEGITAGRFTVKTVLQTARAAQSADTAFN